PPSQRQGAGRPRAPPILRAARAALLLRAEVGVRGLPPPGRARVLPPLEREAPAAGRLHALRLDAREPHPAALGHGRADLDLRGDGAAPRRLDHAAAVPGDLGRAGDAALAHAGAAADLALAGLL